MNPINSNSIRERAESTGQEIRKHLSDCRAPPEVLCHYTNASTLLSILKADELWLTNAYYLSDSSEIRHGLSFIKERFDERMRNNQNMIHVKLLSFAKKTLEIFNSSKETYVICFCKSGDLVSQWQVYGAQGRGFSIGIRSEFLKRDLFKPLDWQPQVRLRCVEYEREQQEAVVYKFVDQFCSLATDLADGADERKISAVIDILGNQLGGELLDCVTWFKHEAFKNEEEWRLICTVSEYHSSSVVKFRNRGHEIVPYLPLTIASVKPLADAEMTPSEGQPAPGWPIASITIGPTAEPKLAEKALSKLLESHFGREHSIRIIPSPIPLRSIQ